MTRFSRRGMVMSLAMGLASSASALAQQIPEALPPLPASPPASGALPESPTLIFSAAPVVSVPPMGVQPSWFPPPIDPVALARCAPGHVEKKSQSWLWRRSQAKILGYPEDFQPRAFGSSVYDHCRTMVANGAAANLTLFDFDFVPGTGQLTPRGRLQLAKFSAQLNASPFPLIIESTPSRPSLANVRRYTVLAELAAGACPVSTDRVLVGVPRPVGISGVDADLIGRNEYQRVQQYGPPIPILSSGVNSPSGGPSVGSSGPNQ